MWFWLGWKQNEGKKCCFCASNYPCTPFSFLISSHPNLYNVHLDVFYFCLVFCVVSILYSRGWAIIFIEMRFYSILFYFLCSVQCVCAIHAKISFNAWVLCWYKWHKLTECMILWCVRVCSVFACTYIVKIEAHKTKTLWQISSMLSKQRVCIINTRSINIPSLTTHHNICNCVWVNTKSKCIWYAQIHWIYRKRMKKKCVY